MHPEVRKLMIFYLVGYFLSVVGKIILKCFKLTYSNKAWGVSTNISDVSIVYLIWGIAMFFDFFTPAFIPQKYQVSFNMIADSIESSTFEHSSYS
jgi:H+/Cl- antiporter ClcA